jgi:hypothetical protein
MQKQMSETEAPESQILEGDIAGVTEAEIKAENNSWKEIISPLIAFESEYDLRILDLKS